ncbi:hypothetical protein ACH5RR_008331 [Cinchona calisaya]|uniref:FAS1 domain-containing protein n=1 Tax=Cinchona calisaya TaxID=153742 RepID=A0ABD3ACU3_9GENT
MINFKNQILFYFFLLFYSSDAFNITQFLGQYTNFSTFNNYLIQTQLADSINSRQTITILAVDNDNISPLSEKPADVLKDIISVHVILDYYDFEKLHHLPNKTAILTTLFQASGLATGQQGFLNVTVMTTGSVVFGSAVEGPAPAADATAPSKPHGAGTALRLSHGGILMIVSSALWLVAMIGK